VKWFWCRTTWHKPASGGQRETFVATRWNSIACVLLPLCKTFCWPTYGACRVTGGHLAAEKLERRYQGLWRCLRHAGLLVWFEFTYVEQQPGSKIGYVGAVGRMGSKNSTGNRRGSLHTSSADDAFKSSLHALGIPNNTSGSASAQCSSAWHIRAALTSRGDIYIFPLKAGCHTWSRGSGDGGQRLEEKGHKLLLLVGCDLLGVESTSATYSTCTSANCAYLKIHKCISFVFKSSSAPLSYWKEACFKNKSSREQLLFIAYNLNSMEMRLKCPYSTLANGLGQSDVNMSTALFAIWVQFLGQTCENCGKKGTLGRLFSLSATTFPCQYPSTNAPCSFIYHRCYEILIIHFLQ
jgi:hypothetical protein